MNVLANVNLGTSSKDAATPDEAAALAAKFLAAVGKSSTDGKPALIAMVVPPTLPLPPQAPPPASGSALAEAEQLSANWDKWGMHNGVSFNNPPSSLPPDAQATIMYFGDNSVLYQSIIKDAGGSGNTLTKAALDQFISDAKGDVKLAAESMPPGTPANSILQNLSALITNWHAWGLHSGVTPLSNPPPSDLPPDAKAALGAITSDPYLLSQIGNGTGKGVITQQDVANFLKQASANPVLLGQTAQDQDVHGWLDSLGGAVSAQDKSALAQTADDATTLQNWFNAFPRGSSQLNTMPPDIAAAEKRLLSNDAVSKQLVLSSGQDKGEVTRDTVNAFVSSLNDAANAAKSSWQSFEKSAPNADPTVTHMALDAAILQANTPILDQAGAGSKLDGEIDVQDLQAVVSGRGNAGLPDALKHAAALFASPGMFANLDTAGDDPATTQPDGLMDSNNLGGFITKEVSKMTPALVAQMLSDAANRNLTANVDVSKLGPDVFQNPQNYSGAQKAAVLQQLEDLYGKISAGNQEQDWDQPNLATYDKLPVNPNVDKVLGDIQGKINQLAQDPDVQKYLTDGATSSLQSIAGADPGMKSALQGYFDGAVKSGSALTDALNAKDSSGKPVTVEQGLQSYVSEAATLAQALGTDGKPLQVNLQQAVQGSGQEDRLKQAYESDILSGNELKTGIGNGSSADIGTAVQAFTRDAANFGSVLPTDYVSQNAGKLQQTFSDTLSDSLFGTATSGELNAAFADGSGNLDTAKLNDVIQQAQKQNPDAFKDADGNLIPPDKIVSAFKSVFDDVRQGAKLQDAIGKLGGTKPTGALNDVYQKGLLHAVSALFAGGILAAKGAEGGSNPLTVSANLVAGSFQVMGGVMEAGAKYAKTTTQTALSSDELKLIEGAGKALGGAAGIITGALSIFSGVQALQQGDKPVAGIDIASGITGAWAGVSGLLEGGLSVAEAFGSEAAAAALPALAATTATLGIGAAVVGGLAVLGLLIYELVEGAKDVNAFNSQIGPELAQWGITGGPVEPGDEPPQPISAPGTYGE